MNSDSNSNRVFEVQRQPYGEPGTILREADIENKQMIDTLIQRGALKDVTPPPAVEIEPESQLAQEPTPLSEDAEPSQTLEKEPEATTEVAPVETTPSETAPAETKPPQASEPSTSTPENSAPTKPASEPTSEEDGTPEQTPSAYALGEHES